MMPEYQEQAGDRVGAWTEKLRREGYCLVPDTIDPAIVEALRQDLAGTFEMTPFCKGGFYGERTKRFGRLLIRSRHSRALVMYELVLGIAERILLPWCDNIQLNLTQGLALHPGALSQVPHRDQDMWRGAVGEAEYLVNVMWPFTPYREENGATLIWPNSHGPKAILENPEGEALPIEADPGSALIFLGSTLHGAGGNRTMEPRYGAIISYCLGWLKPYENQWLAYPPGVARHLDRDLAALVGYRQHRPNLGNFEGQCPSILLDGEPDQHLPAIDALRPDQAALVAGHVAAQKQNAA